ncbi:MAG: L-serine ammonia-lyase, iron-sulfur-dependent, subunit alpha [bacterium]
MKAERFIEICKKEVIPALGCTEPIAVALAAAVSRENIGKEPEKTKVFLSGNVMKNGMGVGIPGTGMVGLKIAAALGIIGGDPSKNLELLYDISGEDIEKAKKILLDGKISIGVKEDVGKLYIEAVCYEKDNSARTVICGNHTNIVLAEYNGSVIFQKNCDTFVKNSSEKNEKDTKYGMTVRSIWDFIHSVPLSNIEYINEGAEMNREIGLEGLRGDYGLRVGKTLRRNCDKGYLKDDLSNWAMALTAAASDARMAGSTLSVMSNSGSGNQGITAMLPVLAVAEKLNCGKEKTTRALYLSNLIAIHLKEFMARLSALCGVVTAASGAACGITYLMDGDFNQIGYTIKNMIGNISGMICDGAKAGCALKVSTAVSASLQSVFLAMENIEISEYDGIIEKDIEKTIKNLALISSEGMETTDKVILDIMSCK